MSRIKSKQRRKNMRKWMASKGRRQVFEAMAGFGEYQHPDLVLDGVPLKWKAHRWVQMPNGSVIIGV